MNALICIYLIRSIGGMLMAFGGSNVSLVDPTTRVGWAIMHVIEGLTGH